MISKLSTKQVLKVQNNIQSKMFYEGLQWSCLRELLDLGYVRISGLKLCDKMYVCVWFFYKVGGTEGCIARSPT